MIEQLYANHSYLLQSIMNSQGFIVFPTLKLNQQPHGKFTFFEMSQVAQDNRMEANCWQAIKSLLSRKVTQQWRTSCSEMKERTWVNLWAAGTNVFKTSLTK